MQETFRSSRLRQNLKEKGGRIFLSTEKGLGVHMTAETYLCRGKQQIRNWAENPKIYGSLRAAFFLVAGMLLSAAGVCGTFVPVSMGMISAMTGWPGLLMTLGGMLGYRLFWGAAGIQGTVWAAAGGMLSLLMGGKPCTREQPVLMPIAVACMVSCLGLMFQMFWKDDTPVPIYFLRIGVAAGASLLANQLVYRRDRVTDWLAGGVAVLALAQVMPVPYLGLGYMAAGMLGTTGAFPAAILAGLGLDLAQVTKVPMTAVLCGIYLFRLLPRGDRWGFFLAPGLSYMAVSLAAGVLDPLPLPGLILGGAAGLLAGQKPETRYHRGPTGAAQVRLELSADLMRRMQQMMLEQPEPEIDQEALLEKARERACSGCSYQKSCMVQQRLSTAHLMNPLAVTCRKTGRLMGELRRSQEQMLTMKAEQKKRQEYRQAMMQQYCFLSDYLRGLADQIPRRAGRTHAAYKIQVSARSRGKHRANGDRCLAFPGPGCRYFVLLCDGMGTGLGAAEESRTAGDLLRQMLISGFPPEYALQSMNNLMTLRGQAGAVTADLAEIRLDTGRVTLHKWGAAPSWILGRRSVEKIGTATPPPGLSILESRESAVRLSLRRGEVLILFSDGVDGEDALRRMDLTPEMPPGELAEVLLERGCGKGEDDATAAVIRLHSTGIAI